MTVRFSSLKCFIALLILSTIISCKKSTDTADTQYGKGKISYFAKASFTNSKNAKTAVIAGDSVVNSIAVNWTYATVWVEKINFSGSKSGFLDTTVMIERNLNIFNLDAFAGFIQLPEGSYKDVKVKMFCRKSPKSEFAFDFRGTFTNTSGSTDSIRVGSSYPFEADVTVTEITMNNNDDYKVTANFNLDKVLAGIKAQSIEMNVLPQPGKGGSKNYVIWKGGSQDVPFYNQIIQNWQNVTTVNVSKGGVGMY